ncbi:MAG TPA: A/G-specific adenine glycosylase [Candidatus Limnocylindria bacterium]|nr:A/G-specific adenine glycosylase [Candidatus Limnocylindria bacterium]
MGKSYTVSARLLAHYRRTARDLPWRRTHDPYAVLVSEVMLQQTQASRVTPAFDRFIRRFPTLSALAAAPLGAVLREWSGLGYNRRARDLHRIARVATHGLPSTVAELDALPGVGAYTAGAVACFAFGRRVAFADTNIRRVLGRFFIGRPATEREAVALDEAAMPKRNADLWHHALMDLGATLCGRTPRCGDCPLRTTCRFALGHAGPAATSLRAAAGGSLRRAARQREAQRSAAGRHQTVRDARPAAYRDTDRRVRGAIVRALTRGDRTIGALAKEIGDERVGRLTEALVADGLVERAGRRVRLPS